MSGRDFNDETTYSDYWNRCAIHSDWRGHILTGADEERYNVSGMTDANYIQRVYESERIAEEFTPPKVLDFGCGGGRIARHMTSWAKTFIGVDISSHMITRAREEVGHTRFEVHTIGAPMPVLTKEEEIAIDDDLRDDFKELLGYNLVYSWLCLQHMEYSHAFGVLCAIYESLAEDGVFIGTFPDLDHEAYWKCVSDFQSGSEPLPIARVRPYNLQMVEKFMHEAGFKHILVYNGTHLHKEGNEPLAEQYCSVNPAELIAIGRK